MFADSFMIVTFCGCCRFIDSTALEFNMKSHLLGVSLFGCSSGLSLTRGLISGDTSNSVLLGKVARKTSFHLMRRLVCSPLVIVFGRIASWGVLRKESGGECLLLWVVLGWVYCEC